MIIIDTSELRPQSKLQTQDEYYSSTILESLTGADIMVSPKGLPNPTTETLIGLHIQSGAKLIQLKFGHDLIASIIDGRYKESQCRMKLAGANPWQCICLFVGVAHSDEDGYLMINNQLVYGIKQKPLYEWYTVQVDKWISRGGGFVNEPSPKNVWKWFTGMERALGIYRDLPQVIAWPKSPVLEDSEVGTLDTLEYLESLQKQAQIVSMVNDIRVLYAVLPGVGPTRAQIIWDADIRNINDLIALAYGGWHVKVKGIGDGTLNKIREYLGLE